MAYDIISDIHGCYDEMTALIQKLDRKSVV